METVTNNTEQVVRQLAEQLASFRKTNYPQTVTSLYEAFADKGKAQDSIVPYTDEEQATIKATKKRRRFPKQQCFMNSQTVAIEYNTPYKYVEGYVLVKSVPIPIQHAWLTLNGKVVDFTLDRSEHEYFGIEIDATLLLRYLLKGKVHGAMTDDWNLNWEFSKQIFGVPDTAQAT